MRKAGGRSFIAMMESLEGRQLLSFDALAPMSYGDAEQSPIALTAATDPAATAGTVTSLHIASTDVEEGSTVTLDAVVRAHGSVVPVTGSVAFLAITTPGDAPRYVGFTEVQIARPGSRGPEMAFLLGTAVVGSAGTARLEVPSLPLGPHSIVAVFLGNDAPIFETSGDLPRIAAPSEPQTLVTWTPNGPEEVRSWIVEPGGKAFQIRWGTIMFLDEAPEGAHAIPAAGVHLRQTEGYRYLCSGAASTWCADVVAPAATFAPTAQPLRIVATARGGLSRAAYRYEIVPVGLPETLQDKAEDMASSASQPQLLSVKATTDLRLYLGGETTVTNPPAIMGALRRIAGPLEYLLPAVPDRGSIQSATAGLRVKVPGSGGSSGSGGMASGVVIWGGGSSSYSNGSNSISPRQPRIPDMTGTLTFFNGDALLGSVPLTDRRSALYHAAPGSLALGEHQIRVVYSGDAVHRAQEGSIAVQIRKTPTELKLESSVPSGSVVMPGKTFDLKATVRTLVADLVRPSGYVRFYANGIKLGKALLGAESRVRFDLPGGTHELTAVYGGSESMEGSVSTVKLTLTVEKVETQLVIRSGKPVNPRKKPLYVKSQLNLGGHAPKPQGRVIVTVNGKEVGSGKIGKRIKLKVRGLPVGRHAAFAHYTGDDYTLPNTTPMHEVVVTSKTTAFVMPYTAIRPTLRPPITRSITTPIATLGGRYGSVTGGSYSSVSYSYNGDLSLDARVNADDYFRIDGFLSPATEPADAGGELNFDSAINADDYYLIDQAFLGGA